LVEHGNNDAPAVLTLNWMSVQSDAEMTLDGIPLVLCHYPFRTWNGMGKGAITCTGHSHGRLKPMKRHLMWVWMLASFGRSRWES
jgi:calcineurin-like phosphoesterase family protein